MAGKGALQAAPNALSIAELLPQPLLRLLCSPILRNAEHTVVTCSRFCSTAAGRVVSQYNLLGARSAVILQLLNCHWSSSFLQASCLVKRLQQPRNYLRINRGNVNTSEVHSGSQESKCTFYCCSVEKKISCFWFWIFPVPACIYMDEYGYKSAKPQSTKEK